MSDAFTNAGGESIANLAANLFAQGRLEDAAVLFRGLAAMGNNPFGEAGLGAIALVDDPPDIAAR